MIVLFERTQSSNSSNNQPNRRIIDRVNNSNSNNSSPSSRNDNDNHDTIPCPECNQQIPFSQYQKHQEQHIEDTTGSATTNISTHRTYNHSNVQSVSSPINHNDADLSDIDVLSSPPRKKRRVSFNQNEAMTMNVNRIQDMFDIKDPIKIGADHYRLVLLYDESKQEEEAMNSNKSLDEFTGYSQETRLVYGDYIWSLIDTQRPDNCYLYPIIIEKKSKNDLLVNHKEEKRSLSHFRVMYLLENVTVTKREEKKMTQVLVDAVIDNGINVQYTSNRLDTVQMLVQFTLRIYQQIMVKLHGNDGMKSSSEFFQNAGCVLLTEFKTKVNDGNSTSMKAKEWFKQTLQLFPGVDETVASLITSRYGTMRRLLDGWDHYQREEERKRMLYNLEGNNWVKCRIDGHYKGNIEEDVLTELDRIGERPISETLSAKLYEKIVK